MVLERRWTESPRETVRSGEKRAGDGWHVPTRRSPLKRRDSERSPEGMFERRGRARRGHTVAE